MTLQVLVCLVGLALLVIPNFRIVNEGERVVVFRLGHYHRILGPGLNLIILGVDVAHRVVLMTAFQVGEQCQSSSSPAASSISRKPVSWRLEPRSVDRAGV